MCLKSTIVAALFLGLAGCVTTESFLGPPKEVPLTGPVHQVHATWESRVMITQDVANQGAPLVGLAGRMYLFGQELAQPVQGNGSIIVDLHDLSKPEAGAKPKMLERWEIDKDTLKRLLKKDTIGWGYTLFLPWSTYKQDMTKVQLQLRYVPEKGVPLFSPASVVTLRSEGPPAITSRQAVIGGAGSTAGPGKTSVTPASRK